MTEVIVKNIPEEVIPAKKVIIWGNLEIIVSDGAIATLRPFNIGDEDIRNDPIGFINFAKELDKALFAPTPEKKPRKIRSDKNKKKNPKNQQSAVPDTTNSKPDTKVERPHLETKVPHEGQPAEASYDTFTFYGQTLNEALTNLKMALDCKWPDTLTQAEKQVITASTGEEF